MGWVLVVEDDAVVRLAIIDLLTCAGFAAEGAADGSIALQLLQAGARPDLILLDSTMPRMTGAQLRAALLGDEALAKIPVVVISGGDPAWLKKLDLRAADYLEKPFDPNVLLDMVARHLGQSERSSGQ